MPKERQNKPPPVERPTTVVRPITSSDFLITNIVSLSATCGIKNGVLSPAFETEIPLVAFSLLNVTC